MTLDDEERKRRARLIVDEYQGIHPPWEILYISHIQSTCRASLAAFNRFEELAIAPRGQQDPGAAFEALGLALAHSAAVSRFFKPSRQGIAGISRARGDRLARAFAVGPSSALNDRGLRDAIEHYDERLDEYLLNPQYGNTIGIGIGGPAPPLNDAAFPLRWVNIVDGRAQILGQEYDYSNTKREIMRVLLLADKFMESGCRLPA